MITHISTVSIFVNDQDRAKDFYVNTLGFKLIKDEPLYPGAPNRWLSVAPEGAQTEVILYKPDQNWEHFVQTIGQSQSLTFNVSDMDALVASLKSKGVQFTQDPDKQPWGTMTRILDSEGNGLLLVQPAY